MQSFGGEDFLGKSKGPEAEYQEILYRWNIVDGGKNVRQWDRRGRQQTGKNPGLLGYSGFSPKC